MAGKIAAVVAVAVVMGLSSGVAEANRRKAPAKRNATYDSYGSSASAPAASGGGQRMAGCGLGSMAIESNDKWSQVGASILNGTGVQTFGISFGTSNCTEDGVAQAAREKEAFIEANYADIQRDVAVGEGEYLASLAGLYGCEVDQFGLALQRNQQRLLSAPASDATNVIDSVVVSEEVRCQG